MIVFLLFVVCLFVLWNGLEGRKEGMHHLSCESWPRLEGVVSPSSAVSWWKEAPNLFWYLPLLIVGRTSTGDGCVFLLEPRAYDSKPTKIK